MLFDLDGTLADTAPDLAHALNRTLRTEGYSPMAFEEIKPYVSLGADAMLGMAFPTLTKNTAKFDTIKKHFLEGYNAGQHRHTRLFPGIETVLSHLEKHRITWGIVTNKLTWLTKSLIERLALSKRTACVVCGDSTDFKKPHPRPLQYACQLIKCDAQSTVYIGDVANDIEAGHRAGMKALAATYGYAGKNDDPYQWNADGYITAPEEIVHWLEKENSLC